MRYSFVGKDINVSDGFKEKISAKLNRIAKLFPEDTETNVSLSSIKLDKKVEVTIKLPKRILRAEVTRDDMNAAIDEVVDILENQMVKYKNRLRDKSRKDNAFYEELTEFETFAENLESEDLPKIARTKKFFVKPMDAEEAVMEMEMLGHSFFVFRNSLNEQINVVYKRKDGSYGLIDPEY